MAKRDNNNKIIDDEFDLNDLNKKISDYEEGKIILEKETLRETKDKKKKFSIFNFLIFLIFNFLLAEIAVSVYENMRFDSMDTSYSLETAISGNSQNVNSDIVRTAKNLARMYVDFKDYDQRSPRTLVAEYKTYYENEVLKIEEQYSDRVLKMEEISDEIALLQAENLKLSMEVSIPLDEETPTRLEDMIMFNELKIKENNKQIEALNTEYEENFSFIENEKSESRVRLLNEQNENFSAVKNFLDNTVNDYKIAFRVTTADGSVFESSNMYESSVGLNLYPTSSVTPQPTTTTESFETSEEIVLEFDVTKSFEANISSIPSATTPPVQATTESVAEETYTTGYAPYTTGVSENNSFVSFSDLKNNADYFYLIDDVDWFSDIYFNNKTLSDAFTENRLKVEIMVLKTHPAADARHRIGGLGPDARNRVNGSVTISYLALIILVILRIFITDLGYNSRNPIYIIVKKAGLIFHILAIYFCYILNRAYFRPVIYDRSDGIAIYSNRTLLSSLPLYALVILSTLLLYRLYRIFFLKEKLFDVFTPIKNNFKIVTSSKNIFLKLSYYPSIIIFIMATFLLFIIYFNSWGLWGNFFFRYYRVSRIFYGDIFQIYPFLYLIGLAIFIYYQICALSFFRLEYFINSIGGETETFVKPNFMIKGLMSKINTMEDILYVSLKDSIKSEKLKAELITNVSHDLKTPLTSIINYVELLKREGLSSNSAPEYLSVLDQKSHRLKLLIEDLFEASKLSTGNIELEIFNINVTDLIRQSIGELESKIFEKDITLKFSTPENDVYLNADGKKLWRAIENLLNNIIKYSLEGTRAYIDLEEFNDRILISFKNISAYELNFSADELFERFKRGDLSRNTEGNGLGLSIAENIVNLHNGSLDIIIDGDLFKAIITLYKK